MSRVTLQTIADAMGVSRMTVSNAFSRPDQLSVELRDRILSTAERLGYTGPDPSARALAKGAVGTIGLMLTDRWERAFSDEIATRLLAAISEELGASGRGLTLLSSTSGTAFVPARDVPLDGALVYSCGASSEAVEFLVRRKLPLVFLDQRPVEGFPSLNIDDRGGAMDAARHVVELGHRRVALVTKVDAPLGAYAEWRRAEAPFTAVSRLEGWAAGLAGAGIEPIIVVNADDSTEAAGRQAAQPLLGMSPAHRPTAVLAYSDRIAQGVIEAAHDAGLDVPGDLSVVGFDDTDFSARTRPTLTTVHQDVARKGREATALLLDAIARRSPQHTDHRMLPTQLVVRGSTAPPPHEPR